MPAYKVRRHSLPLARNFTPTFVSLPALRTHCWPPTCGAPTAASSSSSHTAPQDRFSTCAPSLLKSVTALHNLRPHGNNFHLRRTYEFHYFSRTSLLPPIIPT